MRSRRPGLVKDILLLNLGRALPFRVTLMVTEECSLRCRTCGIWRIAAPRALSVGEIERFFRANRHLSWVNLTGGEIFTRSDAGEILEAAARELPRLALLNLPTAGQETERVVAAVERGLAAGIPELVVTVSFDGGRETHDILRGRKGAFDRASETYRALSAIAAGAGGRLSVIPGLTLSADLLTRAPAPLDDLAHDLGLDGPGGIHVNIAHEAAHYYRNDALPPLTPDSVAKALKKCANRDPVTGAQCADYDPVTIAQGDRVAAPGSRLAGLVDRIYLNAAPLFLETGRSPLPCKALAASVFVDAGWNVYPCTIFDRPLGNLRDTAFSLETLRRGEAWRATRRDVKAGRCPGCWTPCEACSAIAGNVFTPRGLAAIAKGLAGKRKRHR